MSHNKLHASNTRLALMTHAMRDAAATYKRTKQCLATANKMHRKDWVPYVFKDMNIARAQLHQAITVLENELAWRKTMRETLHINHAD